MKKLAAMVVAFCMVINSFGIDLSTIPTTDADWTSFLDAVAIVESNGRTDVVVTDTNGKLSVGCLQIQQPYLTDSRLSYTLNDMKDRAKSYEVARAYLTRYGSAYTRRTGKPATIEVLIRIHNGGPQGWLKKSTDPYVEKIKKVQTTTQT